MAMAASTRLRAFEPGLKTAYCSSFPFSAGPLLVSKSHPLPRQASAISAVNGHIDLCESIHAVQQPRVPQVLSRERERLMFGSCRTSGVASEPCDSARGYSSTYSQLRSFCSSRGTASKQDGQIAPPVTGPATSTTGSQPAGGKIRALVSKYGGVAICVHVAISIITTAGLYFAIRSHVDVPAILESAGFSRETVDANVSQMEANLKGIGRTFGLGGGSASSAPPLESPDEPARSPVGGAMSGAGALAAAYLCNKVLLPIRTPVTILLTPPIAKLMARRLR